MGELSIYVYIYFRVMFNFCKKKKKKNCTSVLLLHTPYIPIMKYLKQSLFVRHVMKNRYL